MSVHTLMRKLSDPPKPGQSVRVFLKNGEELIACICLVHEGGESYLQWIEMTKANRRWQAIPVMMIKGWMPFIEKHNGQGASQGGLAAIK